MASGFLRTLILLAVSAACSGMATAAETAADPTPASVSQFLRAELSKKYPGARIELASGFSLVRGAMPAEVSAVTILSDDGRGDARFSARGPAGAAASDAASGAVTQGSGAIVTADGVQFAEGSVIFAAWVPAYVASRRVLPGERLLPGIFTVQEVNVAIGPAHDYRGVIFSGLQKLDGLESRQTVLEGQFLTSTAIERIPDVRRGDAVRIEMSSGGVVLSTQGFAEEPAYNEGQVRVMTAKGKRELVGKLQNGGVVEVSL